MVMWNASGITGYDRRAWSCSLMQYSTHEIRGQYYREKDPLNLDLDSPDSSKWPLQKPNLWNFGIVGTCLKSQKNRASIPGRC